MKYNMTRLFDILLWPFMRILGGFKFPVQETHIWHMKKWDWKNNKALVINQKDKKARFDHGTVLAHMPIFGGLTKYVVVEASGFNNYWHVGWKDTFHSLPIKQNRIKLLVGKKGFIAYGLGDNNKNLRLKVVDFGKLGDGKYNDLRLF